MASERTTLLSEPRAANGHLDASKSPKRASFLSINVPKYGATDAPTLRRRSSRVHVVGKNVEANAREWTRSFQGVDWLWETLKEHARLRRLRALKGWQGSVAKTWDRLAGWVLVTAIAIVTALIAYCIVVSEAFLFDLRDGYCRHDWTLPKRYCCGKVQGASAAITILRDPWQREKLCADFETWAELLERASRDDLGLHYVVYTVLAVAFATIAALLTVYGGATSEQALSRKEPPRSRAVTAPASPALPRSRSRQTTAASQVSFASYKTSSFAAPPRPKEQPTMYFAAGSGIPEIKVILGGTVIRGYLGLRTLIIKSVGLCLTVSAGLSLGKEGPLVQIAACVANVLSRFIPKFEANEAKRREIISAACAAGVAVAFGSPIGGVLFSLEEVSRRMAPRTMVRAYFCALVAAMTLKALDPFKNGNIVLFEVRWTQATVPFELVGFAMLGVVGGLYGAFFCKANLWWSRVVRKGTVVKAHPVVEVVLVTVLTAAICFYNPWLKTGGTELVAALFHECRTEAERSENELCLRKVGQIGPLVLALVVAALIKALLTVITFGVRAPAGIFIPTMGVGALLGRAAGLTVNWLYAQQSDLAIWTQCRALHLPGEHPPIDSACVLPSVWGIVGAAAALAGVTRMTISLTVIMAELTSSLTHVMPTMLAVLIAKTVGDALEPRSIYDLTIEAAQLPFLDAKAEFLHTGVALEDLLEETPVISLSTDNTLGSLRFLSEETEGNASASGFPLVAQDPRTRILRVKGYISLNELASGLDFTEGRSPDTPVTFSGSLDEARDLAASTPGSTDFGYLCDHAPLCVFVGSPMELVHAMFVEMGSLYVIVVDGNAGYLGIVERYRWITYLSQLEADQHRSSSR